MAKILVVNNDFDTMTLLQVWLQRKNYMVKYTGDGEEVQHIVKSFNPDVILIDILRSDVAEKLKDNEVTRDVPLLIMTGYTIPKNIINLDKANDTIEKPFDLTLLEKKIENLLRA